MNDNDRIIIDSDMSFAQAVEGTTAPLEIIDMVNDFGPLALYVTFCLAQVISMVRTTRNIKIKKAKMTYCMLTPFRIIPHHAFLIYSDILLVFHIPVMTIYFYERRGLPSLHPETAICKVASSTR